MLSARQANEEPIPGYRLIEPLGSGGFGEVWKCEAPGGLFKAIKFVFGNINSLDVDGARAEQELAALQRVKSVRHPFVCSLDRIEIVGGEVVIVMELADKSLHDAFVEYQMSGLIGIPRDTLLRYIRDTAEALDHMNDKHNLQHLDVKPRNLFLISDRVKVADFGLVKRLERESETGLLGGITPLYASPETYSGKITEFSDQYSLAIVYQELLTGQRPFNGKNARQLAQQHMQAEPELRSLPEAERPVVARALSKNPSQRFANCIAFVRALYTAHGRLRSEPVVTVDDSKPGAPRPKTLAETLEDIQLEDEGEEPIQLSPRPSLSDTSTPIPVPEDSSLLGLTVAQPESGALRPTLIIGVGSFGRKALQELRCLMLDRFGEIAKVPIVRLLYVDPDPEEIEAATRGSPEIAFSRHEVYHLPVHAPSHYRKRALEHLAEWLPRERIYAIPRSLQTQGSRALGRLAFVDNHQRLLARLKRELEHICHPDSLYKAVTATGLALRESSPRVYVFASATGGSSGLLPDLGYAMQRLIQQLGHKSEATQLFLAFAKPGDASAKPQEQLNSYATITELHHFADPLTSFIAQYAADGARVAHQGKPFDCCYLLPAKLHQPDAVRETVSHLASYVFHDLTTPLGLRLDRSRAGSEPVAGLTCRALGTYSVWFPRGLLVRLSAKQACLGLIKEWVATGEPTSLQAVEGAWARIASESDLRPESISLRLEQETGHGSSMSPSESLSSLLSQLEEQSLLPAAQDDPGTWAGQAYAKVRELVGDGVMLEVGGLSHPGEWRKCKASRVLSLGAEKLASEWESRLGKSLLVLLDAPGRRIASVESALARCTRGFRETLGMLQVKAEQQSLRAHQSKQQLEAALHGCVSGGTATWGLSSFLLLGNRAKRGLRVFLDHLAAYAKHCLAAEVVCASHRFFTLLHVKLDEHARQMTFCRQRLRFLADQLAEKPKADKTDQDSTHLTFGMAISRGTLPSAERFWDSMKRAATIRVVLPEGGTDLEKAASRFTGTLSEDQRAEMDQFLQDRVLSEQGGLFKACNGSGDLCRTLGLALIDRAAEYLQQHLPATDVAQVVFSASETEQQDVPTRIAKCLSRSMPLISEGAQESREVYVLIPASDAGKSFGESVREKLPVASIVRVAGQSHLMFCQEQAGLKIDTIRELFRPSKPAFDQASATTSTSPFARFDIHDWTPLDP